MIARHGLSAARALGQNFILDEQLLDRIVRAAGPPDQQRVYEVGPGPGGLTRALLRAGAAVTVVERDTRFLEPLRELAASCPGRLSIIEGDALGVDEPQAIGPANVVANLPYNIATPLLVRWLSGSHWPPWWQSLTLMFQLEVARRIVAIPGTRDYGRLAVLSQWRSRPRLLMKIHRSAFVPPPKVMSALVRIESIEQPAGVDAASIERLTAAAFGQRRKMMRRSLQALPGALEALAQLGIDPERRAETLSVEDFVRLARRLPAQTQA
ncbi:MAG: 16S rRNA (adenine(1518)-N(6)/adenine(1519)-N(6))-dimethyltransferase RsmA [Sphingosinicella sp.]